MKQNFNLDPIQQKEDILVWKYGIFADFESKDLVITKQDEQEFYLTQGYASLPVVSYRSEHPYLDKKIVAIKQIINMPDNKIDKVLENL